MPTIKTAISIDKATYEEMEALSKKLKVSKSRLFTLAARDYIKHQKNRELLESLNEAYSDIAEEESLVNAMRPGHYKLVKDQW